MEKPNSDSNSSGSGVEVVSAETAEEVGAELSVAEFAEAETATVTGNSRRLGSMMERLRGVLPRKAFFLQALLSVFMATTEIAHFPEENARAFAHGVNFLYEQDKMRNQDEVAAAILKTRTREAEWFRDNLASARANGFEVVLGKEILMQYSSQRFDVQALYTPDKKRAQEILDKGEAYRKIFLDALRISSSDWTSVEEPGFGEKSSVFFHDAVPLADGHLSPRKPITAYPLRVHFEKADRRSDVIWAEDMSSSTPVFFVGFVPERDQKQLTGVLAKLRPILAKKMQEATLESLLKRLPKAERKEPLLRLVRRENTSSDRRERIRKFFEEWSSVGIEAKSPGWDLAQVTLADEEKTSVVKEENLPVLARGNLQVTLSREIRNKPLPDNWQPLDYKTHYQAGRDEGENYAIEWTRNLGVEDSKPRISEQVRIIMPSIGIQEGSPPVLHSKEFGDLELSFLDRALEREGWRENGGLMFLHFDRPAQIMELPPSILSNITQGVREAERYFGFSEPYIKYVVFMDDPEKNASFRSTDPRAVFFNWGPYWTESGRELTPVALHEVFHSLDHRYNLSDQLWNLYIRLGGGTFFEELNERRFYERGFGGHSRDNPSEFFSSFMVSLQHPNWKEVVRSKSPDFEERYLTILHELRDILSNIPKISKDSPFKRDLTERIAYLEKVRAGGQR